MNYIITNEKTIYCELSAEKLNLILLGLLSIDDKKNIKLDMDRTKLYIELANIEKKIW